MTTEDIINLIFRHVDDQMKTVIKVPLAKLHPRRPFCFASREAQASFRQHSANDYALMETRVMRFG